jgi:hypothetical protein
MAAHKIGAQGIRLGLAVALTITIAAPSAVTAQEPESGIAAPRSRNWRTRCRLGTGRR